MPQPLIVITIIWVFVFAYAIFASVDFGTGCLYLVAHVARKPHALKVLRHQFQSPVWEVVNIFLIFIAVGLLGFFPNCALFFGTSLMIPATIALVLMVLRGAFIVFQHHFEGESAWLPIVHGVCGLLVPVTLVTILPLSEGGFLTVTGGQLSVNLLELLASPLLWAFIALSLSSVIYFASLHLCHVAKRHAPAGEPFFRQTALISGPPTFLCALLTAFVLSVVAPVHFLKMVDWWPLLALSALMFLVAGSLVFTRRYGMAFVAAVIQYLLAVAVYGWTHLPYLVYPDLTLDSMYVGSPAFHQAFSGVCAAVAIVLPCLWVVYRVWQTRHTG
jgi:cytochrome bd ubiquinol oxidase subunit II